MKPPGEEALLRRWHRLRARKDRIEAEMHAIKAEMLRLRQAERKKGPRKKEES